MTDTQTKKTRRPRTDWNDLSDELERAANVQCKWVDGELWERPSGSPAWLQSGRVFRNVGEAVAYVCGRMDQADISQSAE